jgi:hypothetical protein
MKLCEDTQGNPAKTSTLNAVVVRQIGTPNPVQGQPTGVTKTAFTLTLAAGTYDVRVVITPLPGCKFAYIFEDCGNPQFWLLAIDVIEPDGHFRLIVT